MDEMASIFDGVDVVITPTVDQTCDFWSTKSNFLTNLTGHPSVVIPTGLDMEAQLPTSITFIGDLYKEAETLLIAKALQDATDFHLRNPPLDRPRSAEEIRE